MKKIDLKKQIEKIKKGMDYFESMIDWDDPATPEYYQPSLDSCTTQLDRLIEQYFKETPLEILADITTCGVCNEDCVTRFGGTCDRSVITLADPYARELYGLYLGDKSKLWAYYL